METLPFATKAPQNSTWGFCGIRRSDGGSRMSAESPDSAHSTSNSPPYCITDNRYDEYMPAVLLNTLKKEKKPFTYTPGRVDLSEVLNAKLQKRMDRRNAKIRSPPPVVEESQKQVLVMPTYNSPLNMYSMENALEALEVQAELTVANKSPNSPIPNNSMTLPRNYKYEARDFEPKNVTQSKAFRVLQIITDTEEADGESNQQASAPSHNDELQFKGLRDSNVIPSKFFHNLQKITNAETDDTDQGSRGPKSNFTAHSDEMRFSGIRDNSTIPSKLFHNLQRITNTDIPDSVNPGNKSYNVKSEASLPNFTVHNNNIPENHINPALKRPAAFLPAKQRTTPYSKCYSSSNIQHTLNKVMRPFEGTDF